MQCYSQPEHGFNTFTKMHLNHCHMHTSEDTQVILESWMNSEKMTHWPHLSELQFVSLMNYRTGFFYQPIVEYDLHYSEPGTRT